MSLGSEAAKVMQFGGARAPLAAADRLLINVRCRVEAQLARNGIWFASIACAAILQLSLIVTHRPWLDEWQALLIARQTPTLGSMLTQLHYEGHPPLWYLLLRGMGQVLASARIFAVANGVLAAITFWAILAKAPFSRSERLLLVLNELLLFEVLAVSRSLTLGVTLLFLLLAIWRSRWAWLLLALLPLCDFFFGVIACALIAVRIRDRQDGPPFYAGAALFVICGLLAAWTVVPAPDVLTDPARGLIAGLLEFGNQVGTLLLPLQIDGYDREASGIAWLLLAPAFLYACMRCLRGDRLSQSLLFGFLTLLLLFGCFVYPIYLRHTALAAFLFIALVWIRAERNGRPAMPFVIWLSLAAICGLLTGALNLFVPFDSAAYAAMIIHRQKLEPKLWFSFPAYRAIALAGESGIAFGNLEQRCASQFGRWNFRTHIENRAQLYAALRSAERTYGSFYFVTDLPNVLPATLGSRIARVSAGYDGQRYELWKIGHGDVADSQLPSCVPSLGWRRADEVRPLR